MIDEHWGLLRRPFANTPDPAFTYHSPVFDEGFARLLYDVTELRGGLSLVTGEIGCGKTMLVEALRARLDGTAYDPWVVAYPRMTGAQLLQFVAQAAGVASPPRSKPALVARLRTQMAALHAEGKRPVLMVDEAQLGSAGLLEELRLLTNFEDRTDKHLHVVLLGQPELRDRIVKRPQIDQRVSLRFHLEPLDAAEVRAYALHRLGVAGARHEIFTELALAALAARSGGVPRVVNNVAMQALFVGAMRGAPRVDEALVHEVADDRR
ncbi:MAG TPA: AAA family ATPase [Gemmatimonadaceae bacterium]|nr:AAA family ATPase [Gemmatimonadaceae bacterium]